MTRISSRDETFKYAFTEINMAHIIISLKEPGTECVILTTKHFESAVVQDHVLSV